MLDLKTVSGELAQLLAEAGDETREAVARLLYARVAMRQAYITVAGETSSGKSTLINHIFSLPQLLPVGGGPTTATVTHVICREEADPRYFAIFRDATQDALERDAFVALNAKPPQTLLRLQVRACPRTDALLGLHIFDTPGYNSIYSEHEEVLNEFLPESDAVVFVVGYRAGFGQESQDLLETIAALTADEIKVPVFLAVNRAPPSATAQDRRLTEILTNATDTLGETPEFFLIPSASTEGEGNGTASEAATALWQAVASAMAEPERLEAIEAKHKQLLLSLIADADDRAEREELALSATADVAAEQANHRQQLEEQRDKALVAVARTVERLRHLVPRNLEVQVSGVEEALVPEIQASNKWLNQSDCTQWIADHFIPFQIRAIAKSIEGQIAEELQNLDAELAEIANTAIKQLNRNVKLGSASSKYAANLAGTMTRRLGSTAWQGLLRNFGGVGGTAAGAGNLVKKLVSKAGKLVGKTFSKDVYAAIGRTFTKKFMQRANVVVTVIVEVVSFIHTSMTWQGKLIEKTKEGLAEWKKQILEDVLENQIPLIDAANRNSVSYFYDDLIEPDLSQSDDAAKKVLLEDITRRRSAYARLRDTLDHVEE
jgi:hypothetical protein